MNERKRPTNRLPVWSSGGWYSLWSSKETLTEFAYLLFLVCLVCICSLNDTSSSDWCGLNLESRTPPMLEPGTQHGESIAVRWDRGGIGLWERNLEYGTVQLAGGSLTFGSNWYGILVFL